MEGQLKASRTTVGGCLEGTHEGQGGASRGDEAVCAHSTTSIVALEDRQPSVEDNHHEVPQLFILRGIPETRNPLDRHSTEAQ